MNILLVGAGHAHLHVASKVDQLQKTGAAVTLIDPGKFWYSGMASGLISGRYSPEEDSIDPEKLITTGGGHFLRERVTGIDTVSKQVHLSNGDAFPYDLLSFNVGSSIPSTIPGAELYATPVKPISNLPAVRQKLEANPNAKVVIIGGGPTGCEIAASVRDLSPTLHITLISGTTGLLHTFPARAADKVTRQFQNRGIEIVNKQKVTRIHADRIDLDSGESLPADRTLLATGLAPPEWIQHLGLACGPQRGILINDQLQSVDHPDIFAVGDCADLQGYSLTRLGVYGVRQAPILFGNIWARMHQQSLESYSPQKRALQILYTGNNQAHALYGNLWFEGKLALTIKDHIDRKFMRQYR
jgi:NADH dehydrogenase FAD-containing subunit